MKKFLPILSLLCITRFSIAQTASKTAQDAFLITRMAARFHIEPRPLNDSLSADLFDLLLERLDEDRTYFTMEDLRVLQVYRLRLDEEIAAKKSGFLNLLTGLYQKRLLQADSIINLVSKKPFDFTLNEKYTLAEDSTWPADISSASVKLTKKIKLEVLNHLEDELTTAGFASQKQHLDSAQKIYERKVVGLYKRDISRLLQSPGGIGQVTANAYCKALANCYDPHTEFFPLSEKENFDSELGKQPFRFGFQVKTDKEGGAVIKDLEPGSPAYKSGMLNSGDKFVELQWKGKSAIDVTDASTGELNGFLDESNHDTLTITVKKADGSLRKVSLAKEMAEESDEEGKVRSFLLKGNKTIGYISLPAFYSDWEDEQTGVNGCANDVAKEIIKLKKENISGLMIDLRYNGGGSLKEAVDLAGIFIDAGPVELIKTTDPKVITLKDANRGTIYDGPLVILVNGYTASASELVAGTLQDYNRALIVGSSTYGKATGQVIYPLDTTAASVKPDDPNAADSYLKITRSKLFRVNGTSPQATGVKPDISLPDVLELDPHREADEKMVLKLLPAEPNKYYKPYTSLPLASLSDFAKQTADTTAYFKAIKKHIQQYKTANSPKDVSLKLADAYTAFLDAQKEGLPSLSELRLRVKPPFTVATNAYEQQRLAAGDKTLSELDHTLITYLSQDAYVKIGFDLLVKMSN